MNHFCIHTIRHHDKLERDVVNSWLSVRDGIFYRKYRKRGMRFLKAWISYSRVTHQSAKVKQDVQQVRPQKHNCETTVNPISFSVGSLCTGLDGAGIAIEQMGLADYVDTKFGCENAHMPGRC